jgi:alcohol dehydrogenase class IV
MKKCELDDKWGNFSKDFNINDMSENILNDVCARTNPRKLTIDALVSILEDTR